MNAEAPARCLDLSRLVSRVGHGPLTGVDRVERAYLDRLLAEATPLFALVRMKLSYALLERSGVEELGKRLDGSISWGASDLRARLTPGLTPLTQQIESDLRRLALGTAYRPRLAALLRRHLPAGVRFLNVGHSNLTARVLKSVASLPEAEISVLVHDMIPLDFPQYQRPGRPEAFEKAMRQVSRFATRVIYNSAATQERAESYFTAWGRVPDGMVAHLGIERLLPDQAELPQPLPKRPYFVTTGTIEPRKNHELLLDAWGELSEMVGETPMLYIVGSRGWQNQEVFARLDVMKSVGGDIVELNGLGDGALAALLQGATALLFPSHAEGFGLPPAEALALGTPAVVNDLPIYREFLEDLPVYLSGNDSYQWAKTIHEMATMGRAVNEVEREPVKLPSWDTHFNKVLSVT